jgi:hypothetical protein
LIALVFVFFGEELLRHLPLMEQFRRTHEAWSNLRVAGHRVPANCLLSDLIRWRFEELSVGPWLTPELRGVRHLRFGSVVTFLSFRERSVRHLTRELRVYSGGFLSLMALALLYSLPELTDKSIAEVADVVLSHHFIPILEGATILYLVVRLVSEFQTIKFLMSGE